MKKLITGVVLAFVLTGCSGTSEEAFKKAITNTASLTNYTVETTATMGTGEVVVTYKYDGDKTYTQGFLTEHYTTKLEGDVYLIAKNAAGTAWTARKILTDIEEQEESAGIDFEELENNAIFNFENFDLVNGYYALKEATEEYVDFKLKISKGYIVEIDFSIEVGSVQSSIVMKIVDIKSTKITLPAYTIID